MKNFLKIMSLPLLSASLGIISSLYFLNFPFLGLFFLSPLFIFFIKENKLKNLLWGAFLFRWFWGSGIAFSLWDPFIFTLLSLIFLGLPISIYFLKKILKSFNIEKAEILFLIFLPFLWTIWEYLQARYNLISSFIVTSGNVISPLFLGLSSYGGYLSLIFLAALTNTLLAITILKFSKNKKISILSGLVLILIILGSLKISKIELQKNEFSYRSQKNILKIAAISNNDNFDENLIEKLIQDYQKKYNIPVYAEVISFLNPIFKQLSSSDFDILFLPEHFVDLNEIEDYLNIKSDKELIKVYQYFAKKLNRPIAVVFANKQNNRLYNSTFLFKPNGEKEIYNKRRLMFTGEIFPLKNGHSYFAFGKKIKIFRIKNIPFATAMCSEIHYPSDLSKYKKMGAKFIYVPTSNRWAGQGMGLYQYLFLTNRLKKVMAVWLKLPIVNVGRNDFVGVFLPNGKSYLRNFQKIDQNYQIFTTKIRVSLVN